jgi:FMN hydrolase / 5-amino-6-(5-phospho-D-ribitylamino)uracil phosphatase
LLRAMNVDAKRAVFVGDRQHDDISGAAALGMRTVWMRNDFVPLADIDPDAVISELGELLDLLPGWLEDE